MFVVVVVLWRCVRVLGGLSTATTKETFPLSEASALTPPLRGRAAQLELRPARPLHTWYNKGYRSREP